MAFVKGQEKKGGRKKGSLNRATKLAQAMAESILTDPKYLEQLRRRMLDEQPPPALEKLLWNYMGGKPRDPNILLRNTRPSDEKAN